MDSIKWIIIISCVLTQSVIVCLDKNSICSSWYPPPAKYQGFHVLSFNVQEMTSEELQSSLEDPTRVKLEASRSVLQVYGNMGNDDYTLRIDDYSFFNPMDYFKWVSDNGKTYLQLKTGIDRDGFTASAIDDLKAIDFKITCIPYNKTAIEGTSYSAWIYISDVNDNAPMFLNMSDHIDIRETTPVGSIITRLSAVDKDSNLEESMTFSLLSGTDMFSIDSISGDIKLRTNLDFDSLNGNNKSFILEAMVIDGGPSPFKSATTTLEVLVTDEDDQGPAFVYPGCFQHKGRCSWPKYTTKLQVKKDSPLYVLPVPNKGQGVVNIRARDLDAGIASDILFKIASTIPPGHEQEFKVDSVKMLYGLYQANIMPIENKEYSEGFEIFLEAEEQTTNKHFAVAMIYFQNDDNAQPLEYEESNTDRDMGLIAACAVLATLVFCLILALLCMRLRQYEPKVKGGGGNESDTRM